jgi:hypothetical protein
MAEELKSAECGPARGVLLKVPHGSGERYKRFLTWDHSTLARLADELTDEVIRLQSLSNQEGERQRCLDELVRTAQEDGDYDPPTKEGERT